MNSEREKGRFLETEISFWERNSHLDQLRTVALVADVKAPLLHSYREIHDELNRTDDYRFSTLGKRDSVQIIFLLFDKWIGWKKLLTFRGVFLWS